MKRYKCRNCGEGFDSKKKITDYNYQLCPYCYTVKHGKPDASWLPGLTGDDIKAKGFQKI